MIRGRDSARARARARGSYDIVGIGQGDDRAGEEKKALSRAIKSSALCCLYLFAPILRIAFLYD